MQKSIVEEYEKQERKENMNIEDCKTVPEFFGVNIHDHIWVEGKRFKVYRDALGGEQSAPNEASRALVGCLTGQLKWSKHEPMTAEEENILREVAAWFPQSDRDPRQSCSKRLFMTHGDIYLGGDVSTFMPFGDKTYNSKAYRVLAPILEKYGEIDLDEYRGAEDEEPPFGSCDFCGYEFNSELINEYEISHCPKCGEEIEESIDLGW